MRQKFFNVIALKGYSKNTIQNYLSIFDLVVKEDAGIFNKSQDDIISFLSKKVTNGNYSSSYIAQYVSVFNIVIKDVLKRRTKIVIPRPKKPSKQPDILSTKEMQQILDSVDNIKHKTILALMYSTGMRVSEACALKIVDIDSQNGFISIRNAKGHVDRKVMLNKKILEILRSYFKIYKPHEYLFTGAKGDGYSARSVQQILSRAVTKVGIKKNISTHSLRHSCFTQLLKNGVDIRHIQKLAGHKNIGTTAMYLQLSDEDVLNIVSPMDKINL
jgi:site-specific recombinase XerD